MSALTMNQLIIRPAGDRAVLIELPGLSEVLSLQAQLLVAPLPGQVDVLAAAVTVLITADSTRAAVRFAEHVRTLDLSSVPEADTTLVEIDTLYDGEDLAAVAKLTGMSADQVIQTHAGQTWTAAFGGFAPGFAYLVGENQLLEVPRRRTPRTAVPAGSVALAGSYSAVYPNETPGGWQLIGRTAARIWDLERGKPALIRPGDRVRFRQVRALIEVAPAAVPATVAEPAGGLIVVAPGLQSTLQDLGRPGYAELGVAEAGALDRGALRQANRLAGNAASAAVIESLHGGLTLEAVTDQVLAVTGAAAPLTITGPIGGGRQPSTHQPFALLAGEQLCVGAPVHGLRSYIAARGGFEAEPVLGSRSTDSMSGIGPASLAAGSHLAVAEAPAGAAVGNPEPAPGPADTAVALRIVPGPRDDWIGEAELERFCSREWIVTPQSNRIGLRLDGEPVKRIETGELASEGTVRGAVQIPPSGLPVLFLADHPVTGGYPVIGVVLSADLDKAAQLTPGTAIRFATAPEYAPVAHHVSEEE